MEGLHILAEFHDYPSATLREPALRRLCLASCDGAGPEVVGEIFQASALPAGPLPQFIIFDPSGRGAAP